MSRDVRTALVITAIVLAAAAPNIFAVGPQAQPTTSYLALVFQLAPSATPTGLPIKETPTNTPPPPATPTATRTPTMTPTVTNTPPPTSTPTLPPPSYDGCQENPGPGAAPNYPVRITAINKDTETVTLQNVSATSIDLSGWIMCSITGNQQHPIGGTLAPGQSQSFTKTGGPIWNNTSSDPGALYNPNGQLVSYRGA